MTMIVVALSHYVQLWSINVNLMVMEATVEFLWWVVCKVIFVSNPTTVLRLCCRWGCNNKENGEKRRKTSWANAKVKLHSEVNFGYLI